MNCMLMHHGVKNELLLLYDHPKSRNDLPLDSKSQYYQKFFIRPNIIEHLMEQRRHFNSTGAISFCCSDINCTGHQVIAKSIGKSKSS